MHPALRKGPLFYKTPPFSTFLQNIPIFHFLTNTPIFHFVTKQPHFPLFFYKTPIFHFFYKKTPASISFPAYGPGVYLLIQATHLHVLLMDSLVARRPLSVRRISQWRGLQSNQKFAQQQTRFTWWIRRVDVCRCAVYVILKSNTKSRV